LRDGSEVGWWRRTERGAAVALVATGALSVLLFALPGGGRVLLGLPLDGFLTVLAAPLAVLVAAFWFTSRQRALDRRFDVAED
jgi:hypothetical protein